MVRPRESENPIPSPGPSTDEPGYFLRSGEGALHNLFPGVDIRTNSGNQLMLSVVNFAPHSVVPLHQHPHEQMGIMISGRLKFTIGDQTRILGPGDQWSIPGGVPHEVVALEEPAVALDVFHPIRDDYR